MSTDFKEPPPDLDFRALGMGDLELDARMRLHERLAEIADLATREDLAKRGSHVVFFKAYTEYAEALLEGYAEVVAVEEDPDAFRHSLAAFPCWLVAAVIAPHPHTVRPDEDTSSPTDGMLNREDHFYEEKHQCFHDPSPFADEHDDPLLYSNLEPESLWEVSLSRVLSLASVKNKLPRLYLTDFVYILRKIEEWEKLDVEISTRLASHVYALVEEHKSSQIGAQTANAKVQVDRSAVCPKLNRFAELRIHMIADENLQAWWEPNESAVWNFKVLEFEDGRGSNNPNKLWKLLRLFALKGDLERPLGDNGVLEKSVGRLRKHLRELFQTEDDPLPFDRTTRSYSPTFRISPNEPDSL